MPCDPNCLKPLFLAIQGTKHAITTHDYSYILPVSSLLRFLTIMIHIVLILLVLIDITYLNIFSTLWLFPLITMPLYNIVNTFLITLAIFSIILIAVHISIISPFLSPSMIKYTERSYILIVIKSCLTKLFSSIILFSISPLLLLYICLILFIIGNSPIKYFQPNIGAFHNFHLHIHNCAIPSLIKTFNGLKSNEWISCFIYLLFNCAIIDEFIMKTNSPNSTKQRSSFVNLLAGNDANTVLKRVNNNIQNIIEIYKEHGNQNDKLIQNNYDSWMNQRNHNENNLMDDNVYIIKYNIKYAICCIFPFNFVLFWAYFSLNYVYYDDDMFRFKQYSYYNLIFIGAIQLLFYILSILLFCIHYRFTVLYQPLLIYNWSNYSLMDFYCSFHDDDENESFKTKLTSYINLFTIDYKTSIIIRENLKGIYDQDWLPNVLVSMVCVMDAESYKHNAYNSIMNIISRTVRKEHIKNRSKHILRNSINNLILNTSNSIDDNLPKQSLIISRKWSNSSNSSNAHNRKPTVSLFASIDEEKECNDGYRTINDESNTSNHSNDNNYNYNDQQKLEQQIALNEMEEEIDDDDDDDDDNDKKERKALVKTEKLTPVQSNSNYNQPKFISNVTPTPEPRIDDDDDDDIP